MATSLSKNFGDDPESQVRKNETMNSYFGVILYQIYAALVETLSKLIFVNMGKTLSTVLNNEDFNDDVADTVDDLSVSIQDDEIYTTSDLMQSLTGENETVEALGDMFDTYMRNARNSDSVDKFIRNIKQNVKYYHD